MFDTMDSDALVGVIEASSPEESRLIARRLGAIAALLWERIGQAEDAPDSDDPGLALVTGFTRASADVAAALGTTPEAANHLVGHAEALDTRLPKVFELLAEGIIDWATTKLAITRTNCVDQDLMILVDGVLAGRMTGWAGWSWARKRNAIDALIIEVDPEGAKERRVHADTRRFVEIKSQPNGMTDLRGSLPAPIAAIADKRYDDIARSVCAHDPRTHSQRRADAFAAINAGQSFACECGRPDCTAVPIDPGPSRLVVNVIATGGNGKDNE